MTCKRCSGLMVVEEFRDSMGSDISRESPSARCLNCGNLEDAVIFSNRQKARLRGEILGHGIGIDMELRSVQLAEQRTMNHGSRRHA